MITWGGNPNFLAFSFMLLALYFIIDVVEKPSKKNIILSGFFLSLIIGTHILVTIFTFGILILFSLLRIIFTKNRKDHIKGNIKNGIYLLISIAIFSLPYVSHYLSFFKNSAGNMAGFNLIGLGFGTINFTDTWLLINNFIAIISIGVTGVFWLTKYVKENRNNSLLLLSLFIAPLLLYLVTAQPLRWLYFLPIPFLLSFSIYARNLYADVKQVKKITITLFATLFMITIIMNPITMAGNHFTQAADFYQFAGKHEIEAYDWIRENTPKEAIFATSGHSNNVGGGGNSYAWWIEGYANRICMFNAEELDFYSFQFERDEINVTNRIFAGTYLIDYTNIRVADSHPAGVDNPVIKALINNKYEQVFTVNDAQNYVYFSALENMGKINSTATYLENGVSSFSYNESMAIITVTYEHLNFWVTRTIIVGENESSVDVIYQISPKDVTIEEFRINIWSLFETSIEDCRIDNNSTITFSKEDVNATIQIIETNGHIYSASGIFSDLKKSRPVANYILQPTEDELYAHLRITIESDAYEDTQVNAYSSYEEINSLGIDYIIISKYRESEYQRFLLDSTHYTVEYENPVVIIFKVTN